MCSLLEKCFIGNALFSLHKYSFIFQADDKCAIGNGGCSHTCIMSVLGMKVCECPSGLTLSSNQRDCEGKSIKYTLRHGIVV